MGILHGILLFIHVTISFLLVAVILMQAAKGGGLSGTFGGQQSSALFGPRGTASALSSITQYLAGGFLVLSFVLSMMAGGSQRVESVTQKVLQTSPASQLPSVDAIDFGSSDGSAATEFEDEAAEPMDVSDE